MGKKKKKQNRNKNKNKQIAKATSVMAAKTEKKVVTPEVKKPVPEEMNKGEGADELSVSKDTGEELKQDFKKPKEVVLEKTEVNNEVTTTNDGPEKSEVDTEVILEDVDATEGAVSGADGLDVAADEAMEEKDDALEASSLPVVAGSIDREIPEAQDGKKRRRYSMWIWWGVGICSLAILVVGGFALAKILSGGGDDGELGSGDMIVEEVPEKTLEETPEAPAEEEEKPEEETKPVTEEPAPEEIPAIAPRPEPVKDYPEVTGGSRIVALTFDDGPSAATTPRLLDILKSKNVKATFFVLGTMARKSPDLLRREQAEGHEVASHTPYHTQQTLLSATQVRAEALEMDQIFTEILGTVPPFTRPPYGAYNQMVQEAMGQPLILWSVDPRDWQYRDASVVCSNVVNAAADGAVILVHDIHASTVDAVPCIIDTLRARGFEFMTVSELAAYKDVPLVNGGVYGRF